MAEKKIIEMDAALKAICKDCDRRHPDDKELCPQKFAGCMAYYNVFSLPEADVNKHGKWKYGNYDGNGLDYQCSCCGLYSPRDFDYCPNCGATMNGAEDSDNIQIPEEKIAEYWKSVVKEMQKIGASPLEISMLTEATITNAISQARKPEDIAWALVQ